MRSLKKRNKQKPPDTAYAMKAWCDTSKPMPVVKLTLDDIEKEWWRAREKERKLIPPEEIENIRAKVERMKAEWSPQTRFGFLRGIN